MKKTKNSYKKSGVNIETADKFTKFIGSYSKQAFKVKNKFLLDNIGNFGSLFDLNKIKVKDPILVSTTDGVGTKLELSNKFKKFDTIGIDLVAMCVNDLIVQGARPLFFLDYIAVGKINLVKMKNIVKGIIKGCKISKCILVGGETAEMPGTYSRNKFDLAGFAVGIVSRKNLIHKNKVNNNDIILAIPSNGLHSNGFSLVRQILRKKKINIFLKKELMKPTKIYVNYILKLVEKKLVNSSAHITGGGLIENITRSVPKNLTVNLDLSKIRVQKIFKWLKKENIDDYEMLKTFNCGIGFCIIVNKNNVKKIESFFDKKYKPYKIGYISKSKRKIKLLNKIKW
tara:strand:+ start:302 stop:1327 length:1026 start_codon:yes stop_codon:yes gene_type:complete